MNKLIAMSVVLLALSSVARAEGKGGDLAETAAWACKAFLDHREDFKPIKTEACEVKSEYELREVEAQCFSHEVEGAKRRFALVSGNGSCNAKGVVLINEVANSQIGWLSIRNADVNGYGFGRDSKPLTYKGKFFITDNYESNLEIVTKNDSVILCEFVYKLQGWEEDKNNTDPVCKEFAQEKYKPQYRQSDDDLKEKNIAQYGGFGPETSVVHIDDIDLEGTGQKVKILTVDYDSGKGCGCYQEWLSIANQKSMNAEQKSLSQAINILASRPRECLRPETSNWSAVEINGKGYIAKNIRTLSELSISDEIFNDRILYKYRNGNFDEICRLSPKMQKIDTQDDPAIGLTYVPVTSPEFPTFNQQ